MQTFVGRVVPGKKLARTLGYPTANLEYAAATAPEAGVWSCTAELAGKTHNALAVIGMWQLANGLPSLEVHLLDFSDEIYDQELQVTLKTKLRDLVTFSSIEELKQQIQRDIELAHQTGF